MKISRKNISNLAFEEQVLNSFRLLKKSEEYAANFLLEKGIPKEEISSILTCAQELILIAIKLEFEDRNYEITDHVNTVSLSFNIKEEQYVILLQEALNEIEKWSFKRKQSLLNAIS